MLISKWPRLLFLVMVLVLNGCRKEKAPLENFDLNAWAADRNACSGHRSGVVESLLSQKDRLLGLDELEVRERLGKPDQSEIYKRNEKFFYYFVEPAPDCGGGNSGAKRLVIRFNAVGLAKEVGIE